jgi:hypothetical protein
VGVLLGVLLGVSVKNGVSDGVGVCVGVVQSILKVNPDNNNSRLTPLYIGVEMRLSK